MLKQSNSRQVGKFNVPGAARWLASETCPIHPSPVCVHLTRLQIQQWYGGPRFLIHGESKRSSMAKGRMFGFLTSEDTNYFVFPGNPGEPALSDTIPFSNYTYPSYSLFTHVGCDPEQWLYAGEYKTHLFVFNARQFRHQKRDFKDMLARAVLLGESMILQGIRKRITPSQCRTTPPPLPGASHVELTVNEVVKSLENGDEEFKFWGLRCTSYNHDFARHIESMYQAPDPDAKSTGAHTGKKLGKKRRRLGLVGVDSDDEHPSDSSYIDE